MATRNEERNGFLYEIEDDGTIKSVTHLGKKYVLHQAVKSSGHMLTKGLEGKVVGISFPFTSGRTTDIIDVDFGRGPESCKYKDLQ